MQTAEALLGIIPGVCHDGIHNGSALPDPTGATGHHRAISQAAVDSGQAAGARGVPRRRCRRRLRAVAG